MRTIKPTNQIAKAERMIPVLEKHVRLQGAVPCKVAESGASGLVSAGLAQWINRGKAIRLNENWPSEAA